MSKPRYPKRIYIEQADGKRVALELCVFEVVRHVSDKDKRVRVLRRLLENETVDLATSSREFVTGYLPVNVARQQ